MLTSVVTITGDGATSTFSFPHGLSGSNFGGIAQANTATRGFPNILNVNADSNNVNITFNPIPANGISQDFNIIGFTY